MTDIQFDNLMMCIKQFLEGPRNYTLTGAADWPIMAFMVTLVVGLLLYVWQDLRCVIKEHRSEWQAAVEKECVERKEQDDMIWASMRDCRKEHQAIINKGVIHEPRID